MSETSHAARTSISGENSSPESELCTATGVHSLIGEQIDGKYRVIEKLGSGGMGAVYKAEHSLMGRTVALKVLHPHLVEHEDLLKRFHREARVASKLDHPNAVATYDYGVWKGAPYLVMEFVEGVTLKTKIEKDGPPKTPELRTIFLQVCAALAKAHDLGIVHRDLKPDNIMLTSEQDGSLRARLLDFGIAKVLNEKAEAGSQVMTQIGSFFGTPKYASPEQIMQKPLDGRSDIYALGVILYEVLSGEVPFHAPSVMEIIIKQLNDPPAPLRQFRPELNIPARVEELVMRCLEKDPAARFQTARELQAALDDALAARRGSGMKRTLVVGGALAACAVGAYAVVSALSNPKSGDAPAPEKLASLANVDSIALPEREPGKEPEKQPPVAEERVIPGEEKSSSEAVQPSQGSNPLFGLALREIARAVMTKDAPPPETLPETEEIPALATDESPPPTEPDSPSAEPPVGTTSTEAVPETAPSIGEPSTPDAPVTVSQQPGTPPVDVSVSALKQELGQLESGKKEAISLYNSGRELLRQKRYAEAAAKFERAIQFRSDAVGSYISLGNCYLRMNEIEKARNAFLSAVRIDSSYGPAHYNLAAFYAATRDSSSALTSLRRALQLDGRARSLAATDPDFASIRNLAEFQQLVRPR